MGTPAEDSVAVLAVDDQRIFLDVAREVVVATPGFEWVGGAMSGEEGLTAVRELDPALVLLDVRMPGMDGIEVACQLSESHPGVVVVLISMEQGPAIASAAKDCGAATLVRKQDFGPAMLRRLWRSHSGVRS